MGLVNIISDGQYTVSNKNDFFKNIANLLIQIQGPIIQATKELPITDIKLQQQLKANDELAQRNLEEIQRQHAIEQNERITYLIQNKEANNLTEAEWSEFNKWFGNTAKAGAQTISTPINVLLNTTTDIGVNLVENVGKLADTGMTSITNLSWGVATNAMILFIPLALIACYKSGLVTAVFKKISRSIEGPPQALPPVPVPVQGPPQSSAAPPQEQTNSIQTTSNPYVRVRRTLLRYKTPTRRGGKKTRKNKKGQTRKLKRGKRRQTRHRNGRKTKRR